MRARVARGHAQLLRPLLLLAAVSAACSGGTPNGEDAPRPTEVIPNAGYATTPIAVKINGSHFLAQARQQAGGGAATLDTRHRAWLGEQELEDVTWVSTVELTATVPAGLAVGVHRLTVENALGERGTLEGAFMVLSGSSLSATVATNQASVSTEQEFQLTLTVANDGSADVIDLAIGTPIPSSSDGAEATLTPGSAPTAPATLAAGASQSFTWTYRATKTGHLTATVGATGKDALSGAPLTATPPAAAQVTVQTPPDLRAELSIPQFVPVSSQAESKDFTVTMTVTNSGGAGAVDVTPTAPSVVAGSSATARLKTGTGATPASAAVPAGQSVTFAWTYTADMAIGSLRLSGGATGKDANSGAAVTAPVATSNTAHVGNAAIIATIESPPAHAVTDQSFDVKVRFENPGSLAVSSFRPETPAIASSPDRTKVTVTGPTPTVAPGAALGTGPANAVELTWNVSTSVAGRLVIIFTALGFDGSQAQPIEGSATATIDVVSP
jgi:hypothetical protein